MASLTIRVMLSGEVVDAFVDFGSFRQLQQTANARLGRFSGDAVALYSNGHTVASRAPGKAWKWTEHGRKFKIEQDRG